MMLYNISLISMLALVVVPALLFSLLILIKGLLNFSRTGPGIKSEILKHYRVYSIYALLRLFLFVLIINVFLSAIGFFIYLSVIILFKSNYSPIVFTVISFLSIGYFSFVQFCKNLLFVPSNIILSSQYSMSNFYTLWQWLSPKKIILMQWVPEIIIAFLILLAGNTLLQDKSFNLFFVPLLLIFIVAIIPYVSLEFISKLFSFMTNNVNNKQPNIIMIGSDTLRKDRVGRIRNTQSITPNIDKLVKKSISFENCFVPIARTAPSLLSFFSGLLPWRHKIRDNFSEPTDCQLDVLPMAKILNNNRYTTAVISDWCGTDLAKFNLGFQWQDLPEDQWNLRYFIRQGPKDIRLFLSLFLQNHFGRLFLPEIFYLGGVPKGKHLIQRSKSWITQLSRQKQPFFLNIFFGTTHPPFGSEYPYYFKYADPNYWGESKFSMARLTEPEEIIRSQKEPKEAFDLDQIIDLYDGTVTNFDDQVADILASIKE
ncbi:MAG TPA: arylsulfatase, partial [Aeromonadales bacterium]|nr:arylsulfatase [Aeromonadales bacterium]